MAAVSLSLNTRADVLVNWTFDKTWAPTLTGAGASAITADNATAGVWDAAGFGLSSNNNHVFVRGSTLTQTGQPLDNSGYFAFSLAPQADLQLQLDQINIQWAVTRAIAGVSFEYTLFSSLDDFATSINLGTHAVASNVNQEPTKFNWITDLGAIPALQNITDSVDFRLYVTASRTDQTGDIVRIYDIALSGGVTAIPEPSIYIMLSLGALLLTLTARRRVN